MTIVCAYRAGDETWLGSDTRVTSEGFIYPERCEKWTRAGKWALALAGSSAGHEAVRSSLGALADCAEPRDVGRYLLKLFAEGDWEKLENKGGPPVYASNAILASADGVWMVSGNGVVSAPVWGFVAAGSGEDFAYGAAYAVRGVSAEFLVETAVRAAIEFRSDCGGDVVVERF